MRMLLFAARVARTIYRACKVTPNHHTAVEDARAQIRYALYLRQ